MLTVLIALIIGSFSFAGYTVYSVIENGGVPKSISETFYIVPRWVFISFLLLSIGVILSISYEFNGVQGFNLTNLGAFFLCGVPCFANMHSKFVRKLHLASAFIGFLLLSLAFIFDYHIPWYFITMLTSVIVAGWFTRKNNPIWHVENVLIIHLLLGYLIKMIQLNFTLCL